MPLVKQRLERLHRRMESEKTVQIYQLVLRDGDCRPQLVVVGFRVWHHDVEPVRCPPLENNNQLFALGLSARRLSKNGLLEKGRHHRGTDKGHRPTLHESPTRRHWELQTSPHLQAHPLEREAARKVVQPCGLDCGNKQRRETEAGSKS